MGPQRGREAGRSRETAWPPIGPARLLIREGGPSALGPVAPSAPGPARGAGRLSEGGGDGAPGGGGGGPWADGWARGGEGESPRVAAEAVGEQE